MPDLSTMPQQVNIEHYGGDTLPIHVKVDELIIAGREFTAQVRSKAVASKIDATFSVVLIPGVGADIILSSEDCRRLSYRGQYEGVWDVQLAMPGGLDPVTTLGFGDLIINPDVTRPVA